jgi:hypothetical protein
MTTECNYKQPALHTKDANGSTLVAVNGSLDLKIVGICFGCRIYTNSESYYYTTKMVSECWTVWERMVLFGEWILNSLKGTVLSENGTVLIGNGMF